MCSAWDKTDTFLLATMRRWIYFGRLGIAAPIEGNLKHKTSEFIRKTSTRFASIHDIGDVKNQNDGPLPWVSVNENSRFILLGRVEAFQGKRYQFKRKARVIGRGNCSHCIQLAPHQERCSG